MKIKVINNSGFELPQHATTGAAGLDLRAAIQEPITLEPQTRVIVPTGLMVEIPLGYEMQIRPRSGLAAKHGITVLNSPGTIDSDFRGEIGIILYNTDPRTPFTIERGERIAQAIVAKYEKIEWENTSQLSETTRENGGFGSTGTK